MPKVLITASGNKVKPEEFVRMADGSLRRVDCVELAHVLEADTVEFDTARCNGVFSRFLAQVGLKSLSVAWACFTLRSRYEVMFAAGEEIGIPLALLLKYLAFFERTHPHVMMVAQDIMTPKKQVFFKYFGVQSHIAHLFVLSEFEFDELKRSGRFSDAQLVPLNHTVDAQFFSQQAPGLQAPRQKSRLQACAVGIEGRDYPTLMQAAEGLDLDVVIAASSPWSRQKDSSQTMSPPPNVQINRDPTLAVRQLYADSDFVVVPLFDIAQAAGSTTILEAMAMGKPVICSRAKGQQRLVVDGETGIYVPPGDVAALRQAMRFLLDNPTELQRMGQAGRRRVEQEFTLESYVERLGNYVRRSLSSANALSPSSPRPHS